MGNVGIFGGAFNPPHNEHIRISTHLLQEYNLSSIVFVPTKDAPHKTTTTPFDKRFDMVNLAIKDTAKLQGNKIEKELDGVTYSYIVLEKLKAKYENIAFIIGGDSMINLKSWRHSEKIIKICPLIVIPRGDVTDELLKSVEHYRSIGANIWISNIVGKDISSSLIRANVEFGLDTSSYISKEVRKYIDAHNLYKNHEEVIAKVRKSITPQRFEHTVRTVLTAIRLNDTWGIDYDKVFLAGLLHDCMKNKDKVYEGVPPDTLETKVMHAFNGAIEAEKEYGIMDEEILDAIRYHTTGRPNMSKLEKLIYLADMIEPYRSYNGVEKIRAIAYKDAEKGFFETLESAYKHLKRSNKKIYYLTEDCYNYYKGANE